MNYNIEWELKKALEVLNKGLTEAVSVKDYVAATQIIEVINKLEELLDD